MAGRTQPKYVRFYMDGYDLSGYSRTVGPLTWEFDEADMTCQMSDAVKGYLPNQVNLSPGTLNGVFDNTATSGLHVLASAHNADRIITVAIGSQAAPAAGDPVFCGEFLQLGYHAEEDGGAVIATVPFGPWEQTSLVNYSRPWGHLLHAKSAATAANSSGTAQHDHGAATSYGGYMVCHVFAGDGTATITVEHSVDEVDGNYAALGGCTTGELDFSSVQKVVAATTAKTTTVNRYLRWQISLNGATTVTFALSFVRGLFD